MKGVHQLQAVLLLLAAVALTSAASQAGPTGASGPTGLSPTNASAPIDLSDGNEGDARLVGRVDVNGFATGTLQVFCDGAWGLVCSSNFDNDDALVACRQLGFSTGSMLIQRRSSVFPPQEELAPFVLGDLGCSGDEASLLECPPFTGYGLDEPPFYYERNDFYTFNQGGTRAACDFDANTIARVMCGMADAAGEGDVRLTPASMGVLEDGGGQFGRLEVFHNGGWGTACASAGSLRLNSRIPASDFGADAADVACRQLGFEQGSQISRAGVPDSSDIELVPIVLTGTECTGFEPALTDCPGFSLQPDFRAGSKCRHRNDVYLLCTNSPNPELDGRVRLQGGASGQGYLYGRLEVFLQGLWSNVCSTLFSPASAQVACKELGLDGGTALIFVAPGEFTTSQVVNQDYYDDALVPLAGVSCSGDEASTSECSISGNPSCRLFETSTLLACADTATGCDMKEGTTEGSVRLRGGFGTACDPFYTGFIEVLNDGEWGSICSSMVEEDRRTNMLVPDVVCRQLGFPFGTRVDPRPILETPPQTSAGAPPPSFGNSPTEDPPERIWLFSSEISCTGLEDSLVECDLEDGFREGIERPCNDEFNNGLFVACHRFPEGSSAPEAEEGDLRLVNKTAIVNWVTGQLQVFLDGSWGQVCTGFFDAPDANVACRQLGYGAGTAAGKLMTTMDFAVLEQQAAFPIVAIAAPGCNGTESRLVDCAPQVDDGSFRSLFGPECRGRDSIGLVIGCVSEADDDSGTEGAFRLTNTTAGGSPGSESGVLEVFHAGAWGTICDGIGSITAEVACREFGFESGFVRNEDVTATVLPLWLSGIFCNGSEAALAACGLPEFGDTAIELCERVQRLYCFTASDRALTGMARLVEGSAAPGGEWEYGRLEVLINGFWSTISEAGRDQDFGRRGAEVACRSLGFAAGAQLRVGRTSPFAVASETFSPTLLSRILCNGTEGSLAECSIEIVLEDAEFNNGSPVLVLPQAVSLICSNPSGCGEAEREPVEGDVRLMPINGTTSQTAPCDAVHHGAVELFHAGRWGRICTGTRFDAPNAFTVDAQVVCRQLGFPFGSLMDEGEAILTDYDLYSYLDDTGFSIEEDAPPTWATQVVCTGKEERLLDCAFPEEFGGNPDDGEAMPDGGLARTPCGLNGNNRFAVICRRFEIAESNLIRR